MSPQPKSKQSTRKPEITDFQTMDQRARDIDKDFVAFTKSADELFAEQEQLRAIKEYDPTISNRDAFQLKYDFERHTHEEFTRIGEGGGGDPYYFKATKSDTTFDLDISAGQVVCGFNQVEVAEDSITLTIGDNWVVLEVWYNAGWQAAFAKKTAWPEPVGSYPYSSTGGYIAWKILIAYAHVAGSSPYPIVLQQVHAGGETHNPRVMQ